MHAPVALAFAENLVALKRASRQAAAVAFDALGLNDTQLKMLRHIDANPSVTQADLARATETDPSLLGRALRVLVDDGMVKRTPSRDDKRAFVISVTVYGRRVLATSNEARERLVRQLAAPLDAKDFADFERITKKIVSAVEKMSAWEDPKSRFVTRRVKRR